MLKPIDNYFLQQGEPAKSCLQFLRKHILESSPSVTEKWQYGMPFYYYNGKRCCYLWIQKRTGWPYLGIVEGKLVNHPDLLSEKRSRMKILLIDPSRNIPVKKINLILKMAFGV